MILERWLEVFAYVSPRFQNSSQNKFSLYTNFYRYAEEKPNAHLKSCLFKGICIISSLHLSENPKSYQEFEAVRFEYNVSLRE